MANPQTDVALDISPLQTADGAHEESITAPEDHDLGKPSSAVDIFPPQVEDIRQFDENGVAPVGGDKHGRSRVDTDDAYAAREDLEPSERADHSEEYDPAEPLVLEDLMRKDELVSGVEVPEGVEPGVLDFMKRDPEEDAGTEEDQMDFARELEAFFMERKMEYKPPKFYGQNLNCLQLWRTVVRLGGYKSVTTQKLWRQVGERFKPPKTCTTVSWLFRGFYEKALLDYERFKLHGMGPSADEGAAQYDASAQGAECSSGAVYPGTSQACTSYMPNLGRARRDAASRAMQGWHSPRLLSNGEVGDPIIKDRSSIPAAKREKQLKMGLLKRKKATNLERAVQAARIKGSRFQFFDGTIKDEIYEDGGNPSFITMQKKKVMKQENGKHVLKSRNCNPFNGTDIWVADEGPQADWVKINVHKTRDCFEVYALVPGLLREEVRIQCEPGGQIVIAGEPEQLNNPWGVTPFKKVINLPLPIDANQTAAVVTHHGQLFVRVPYA